MIPGADEIIDCFIVMCVTSRASLSRDRGKCRVNNNMVIYCKNMFYILNWRHCILRIYTHITPYKITCITLYILNIKMRYINIVWSRFEIIFINLTLTKNTYYDITQHIFQRRWLFCFQIQHGYGHNQTINCSDVNGTFEYKFAFVMHKI